MHKTIMTSGRPLGRLFRLCRCLVFFCGTAFAEDTADLANTEKHEGFLSFCTLPDGGLVLAGYTEIPDESGPDKGRILCLNPDRTVRWMYVDTETFGYGKTAVTADGTLAAFYYDGVRFFTPEGEPTGKNIPLIYTSGEMYGITSFGILSACRMENQDLAESLELKDWDGNVLFRAGIPESMWYGSDPIEEEDGLVLCGQEAGDPSEAAAKIMKVDLQGNTVWETVLPFLSDRRNSTGVCSGIRTGDGGYLAVQWEWITSPVDGNDERKDALIKFDAAGKVLWTNRSESAVWQIAEYDGKYAAYRQEADPETGRAVLRYLWLDPDGNELGTTELQVREEDLPRYADSGNVSVTVEKLIPMDDGLWQVLCFWDTDEPEEEEPAWTQQDNLLVRVPEL